MYARHYSVLFIYLFTYFLMFRAEQANFRQGPNSKCANLISVGTADAKAVRCKPQGKCVAMFQ